MRTRRVEHRHCDVIVGSRVSLYRKRTYQLLPHIVAQIPAVEVFERPVNVLDELVQDAVDLGATCIEIKLQRGGPLNQRVVSSGEALVPGSGLGSAWTSGDSQISLSRA